jgi:hypothetical protein
LLPGEIRHDEREGGVDEEVGTCAGPEVPSEGGLAMCTREARQGKAGEDAYGAEVVLKLSSSWIQRRRSTLSTTMRIT